MLEEIQIQKRAESIGFKLVKFESPVSVGLYRQPSGQPSYRLVDSQGNIKTYGTLETIQAYLMMNNRF